MMRQAVKDKKLKPRFNFEWDLEEQIKRANAFLKAKNGNEN
ncbi:hypothetical protein [Algibacter sp. PT7-4]